MALIGEPADSTAMVTSAALIMNDPSAQASIR
jgi:hypothetical protein